MIEHSPDVPHPRARVHQLIQRVTRESLAPINHADATRSAADCLLATYGEHQDDGAAMGDFLANAQAVLQNAQNDLWTPEPHALLYRLGASLGADYQLDAALDHFRQLVETANCRLGADNRHTLAMLHNLAYWQWRAGDLDGASAALEGLLGDAQRTLGPTAHLALATRRVLANVRGEAGEIANAITELAKIFENAVESFGVTDPFTLDVRHNLSYWQGQAGDSALAADSIKEVLSIRLQEMDPERMTEEEFDAILGGLTSLIEQQGRAGDTAGAVEQYAGLIEGLEQYLGLNHSIVRSIRTSLAWWKGCSGDTLGAIMDYTTLLEEESDLEAHHPDIRALLHNLGYWKGKSGDLAGGIAILSDLLESEIQALGSNHPDVRLTRRLLTQFHWAAGTVLKLAPR